MYKFEKIKIYQNLYNLFICILIMPTQDTTILKDKIMQILRLKGPSLPSMVAKEINKDMLFTSAFLSELLSEKKIKTSNLKVGSSPIYFIPGQEIQLEKFSSHMKNKEKEAYDLLKSKKILKDKDLDPAIRVALRTIRDFAIPFKKNEDIYWRYFTLESSELERFFLPESKKSESNIIQNEIIKNNPSNQPKEIKPELKKELNIFEKKKQVSKEEKQEIEKPQKKVVRKKAIRKKSSNTKNEKFFDKVKEYLENNSFEILGFEGFSKSDLKLKIKKSDEECLLIAYNKKRINEKDILNAYKIAKEKNMKYMIISLGEPAKKITNFIEAVKNLKELDKIN